MVHDPFNLSSPLIMWQKHGYITNKKKNDIKARNFVEIVDIRTIKYFNRRFIQIFAKINHREVSLLGLEHFKN